MRLICPNCGAQYEVAEDSVPAAGRDVQCSNCGHTWLERPGSSVAAEQELTSTGGAAAGAVAGAAASAASTVGGDDVAGSVSDGLEEFAESAQAKVDSGKNAVSDLMSAGAGDAAANAMDDAASAAGDMTDAVTDRAGDLAGSAKDAASGIADSASDAASDIADKAKDAAGEAAETVSRSVPKHELEDSVADILKQEADLELDARQSESGSLETQTDIPMDLPEGDMESQARDRIAKLKGEESSAAANVAAVSALAAGAAATASTTGKEVLPDIDEINSTLRTNAERGEAVAPPPEQVEKTKRKGFRWGFWGILFLILLAVLIYLFADQIIGMAPASEGAVTGYVDTINGMRGWVNGKAENAITSLETGAATVASE